MILDCWIESTYRLVFLSDYNCLKPIVQWVIAQQGVLAQHIYITLFQKKPKNTFIFLRDCLVRFACLAFFSGFFLPTIHCKMCPCGAILLSQLLGGVQVIPAAPRCVLAPGGTDLPSLGVLLSLLCWVHSPGAAFSSEVTALISFSYDDSCYSCDS